MSELTLRHAIVIALLMLSLTTAGCTPGADLPPLPAPNTTSYTLGAGDRLRIITYGDDQLTGDFTVDDSGSIEVPLLGSVKAKGLTVAQLQSEMVAQLRHSGLLRKPSVSVEISAYRSIFVLGEVSKPGPYPYQPDMTVITAVAVAGGYTYRAVKSRAEVTRTIDGRATTGQAKPETAVQPGDVITILERSF